MSAEAFVHMPGQGRQVQMGNEFRVVWKVTTEESSGVISLLESDERPDFGPPLHVHYDSAEAFYVVQGEYIIYINDQEFVCPAGSFIFIPPRVRHSFRVGSVRSRKLNIYTPAAMEDYFDSLAEAIRTGTATEEVEAEIARRSHVEFLGPPPSGARYV
jgi:mannose-6-phosphate isomerase-like protein (cupin superfamily)